VSGKRRPTERRGRFGAERPLRRRTPVPLAGAVEALAATLEPVTPLAVVQRAWPGAVGPAIAAECAPVSERGGVVTVVCGSAVWAQELALMAPDLVAQLNAALGEDRVAELRCRAG
jgi:predicted nucleic acid-binding Zn ribbon protein